MSNTSATGGYLLQTAASIDGLDLRRFLGAFIVGVSGLPAEYVRPAWQPNPAPVPGIDVDWAAFGITNRRADSDPYIEQNADGPESTLSRQEDLDILVTFYGPNCLDRAAQFRDGTDLTQNTESLFLSGMGIADISDIVHAPELVNERWFDRCDLTITIRREIKREYRILNFVSAYGEIDANRGTETLSREWATST